MKLIVISSIIFLPHLLLAQITIAVTIDEGTVESTCTDPLGGNNPVFQVSIEGENWETYPSFLGLCYNDTPNLQYTKSFTCPFSVVDSIEICFKIYDEDGIPCNQTTEDCSETKCEMFEIPDFGTFVSNSIEISGNAVLSTGTLDFTIVTSTTDLATNDDPCDAIDLGVLPSLGTLGDPTISNYNNICSDGFNEPNPVTETGWNNNQGVWFKFTTSNNPSSIINVLALDDPSDVGDDISLQLALYETSTDLCDGEFEIVDAQFNGATSDEVFNSHCLEANKTYFLLVDGATDFVGGVEGWFGLQIIDENVVDGGDLICNAENMGTVPDGGMISTGLNQSNACATAIGDPNANNFDTQNSVWYQFTAPTSGNVLVEGISDLELPNGLDPVDLQVALFETNNDLCSGNLTEINSGWSTGDYNESIIANCLNPGEPYWIMIDGSGYDYFGVFEVKVSDTGFDDVTEIDTTICAGSTFNYGSISVSEAGPFIDTIFNLVTGCVTPIAGNLSFYDAIDVSVNQLVVASGLGIADGSANANTFGGAGNYTYQWSDGQTSQIATSLIGGETYCVSVTDSEGCTGEHCFEVEYLLPLVITTTTDSVQCHGAEEGVFTILVENAVPPYEYSWQANTSLLNGSGQILNEGDAATFIYLPADTYSVTVTNADFSEEFSVTIHEPDPFVGTVNIINEVSCYNGCDALVEIEFSGGTNPLPPTFVANNLCSDIYTENFVDGNGCPLLVNFELLEPLQIIAATTNVENVSCFGGSDGSSTISISPPVDIVSYNWENGETTQTVSNLTAGTHNFSVTDINGCEWSGTTTIMGPESPLELSETNQFGLICNGDLGSVEVIANGGYSDYTYTWDNGQQGAIANGLSGGSYTVSISDGGDCLITETIDVFEPEPIFAELIVEDGMCDENGGINGGSIAIVNASGGVGPYQYSMATETYSDDNEFGNLAAGPFVVSLIDDLGCIQYYDADIESADSVFVTTNDSFVVFEGDSIQLVAVSDNNNLTYQWSPASNVDCPTCPSTAANQIGQVTYTVVATDTTTNCQGVAQLVVSTTDQPHVYIPNVFTPNGDGINDLLEVYIGAGVEEILNFEIFTRGGDTVFGAQSPGSAPDWGWNGKYKGTLCNPGVYPYVAEILLKTGSKEFFSGTITLLR